MEDTNNVIKDVDNSKRYIKFKCQNWFDVIFLWQKFS